MTGVARKRKVPWPMAHHAQAIQWESIAKSDLTGRERRESED